MRKTYNNLRGAGKSMVSGGENMIQRKKYNFGDLPALFEHEVVKSDAAWQEIAHWHSQVELIRVLDGHIHCHVNHSDFLLHPGELCFINLRQLHRVYNTEKEPCELEVLTVSPELFSQNKKLYKTYILPVINDESFTHVRVEGKNGFVKIIERMMDELQEIAAEKPVGYELARIHVALGLDAQLASGLDGGTEQVSRGDVRDAVVGDEPLGLRALACAGRAEKNDVHATDPPFQSEVVRAVAGTGQQLKSSLDAGHLQSGWENIAPERPAGHQNAKDGTPKGPVRRRSHVTRRHGTRPEAAWAYLKNPS